jgi:hypothetical protein
VFDYVGITQYLADLFPNKETREILEKTSVVTMPPFSGTVESLRKSARLVALTLSFGAMPFADA